MNHVLVLSADPFDLAGEPDRGLAAGLASTGAAVVVFLVQNAVFAARRGAGEAVLARLRQAGATIVADEFSLSERGIAPAATLAGVERAGIGALADHLAAGDRVLWL